MSPTIDLTNWAENERRREEFVVGQDDFENLEIDTAEDIDHFCYFMETAPRRRLIKRFVLGETERTLTYCIVTLIHKDGRYQPRLQVRVDNTSGAELKRANRRIEHGEDGHLVKAAVNLENVHETFWELMTFLVDFPQLDLPEARLAVIEQDVASAFHELLTCQDRADQLQTLRTVVGTDLTEQDVLLLVDRRTALAEFERLLADDEYREQRVEEAPGNGEEDMWQRFFETHPWIFGYGLSLISCSAFDEAKLEQTTKGHDALTGSGDVIDALMKTKGAIESLLFLEMKKPTTDLLAQRPRAGGPDEYRAGVYRPSKELTGAVSQVQVTTHRAVRALRDLHRTTDDGWTAGDVGTIRPRQVVVIGRLDEFKRGNQTHAEHYRSFELYRRSIQDVDVITFDELLARARHIAHDE